MSRNWEQNVPASSKTTLTLSNSVQIPVRKTLLVAWDAADWLLVEPMIDAGELPILNELLTNGLLGWFSVPTPLDPTVLANSLSTGFTPDIHGVLAEGALATDRRVPDLAERFAASGRVSISVGWPASHDAKEIPNLLRVSDLFDAESPVSASDHWPLPACAVTPERLAADIAEIRLHPGEFSQTDLAPLIAGIETMNLNEEPRVSNIARHLAASLSRQSAATYLMENHPWQFACVHFPGIAGVCRETLEIAPPQLPHVPDDEFERYRRTVSETYKLHDQMLGQLVGLAGPDAAVLLCATRGVESGEARPSPLPGEHVETAAFFRPNGFCILRAPGLREDELLHAVRLADLAPTMLWLAGLPIPAGVAGAPLLQAAKLPVNFPAPRVDATTTPPPPVVLPEHSNSERRLHLAISHLNAGRPSDALPLLEKLCSELPDRLGPVLHQINCLRALGRPAEARAILEKQASRPEGGLRPRPGLKARFFPHYDLMRGLLHLDEGNPALALPSFQAALVSRPQHAGLHVHLARALLALRKPAEAEASLRTALAINPDEAEAHFLLTLLLYKLRRFPEALQPAMEATAKLPLLPQTHLVLGCTLARLGRSADAIFCLENALRRAPGLRLAHRLLARLARGNQPPKT